MKKMVCIFPRCNDAVLSELRGNGGFFSTDSLNQGVGANAGSAKKTTEPGQRPVAARPIPPAAPSSRQPSASRMA